MSAFSIGQLAKRVGVGIGTVRYYERNRLLAPAGRLALGSGRNVAKVRRAAQAKLADIEQRLEELERMGDGLRKLVAACPGHGRAEDCPILNALQNAETR